MLYIEAEENEVTLSEPPVQQQALRTQLQVAEDRANQMLEARRLLLEETSEEESGIIEAAEATTSTDGALDSTKIDWGNLTLLEFFEIVLSTLLKFAVMGLIIYIVITMLYITGNVLAEEMSTFGEDALNSVLGYVGELSG